MFSSPRNLIPEILTKISTIEGEGSRDEPKNSGWGKGKLCTDFFSIRLLCINFFV